MNLPRLKANIRVGSENSQCIFYSINLTFKRILIQICIYIFSDYLLICLLHQTFNFNKERLLLLDLVIVEETNI